MYTYQIMILNKEVDLTENKDRNFTRLITVLCVCIMENYYDTKGMYKLS